MPGLARGLPPDGSAWPVQLLRGVHPHHRLDVQPAREMVEGDPRHPLAPAGRLPELPALVARVAPGPQRLLASGPRLHRPRGEQEGRGDPGLPTARREHPALGRRPLPALAELRQRDRRRQATRVELPLDRGRDRSLHARSRDLGLGLDRRRRRARRRAGVLWRHPDARDPGRGGHLARAPPRPQGARRQRRRPDAPAATTRNTRMA